MKEHSLRNGYLSPHFTLQEMIFSETAEANGINNNPPPIALVQLYKLCNDVLEQVRSLCGDKPVMISSGFRCAELNQMIGGATGSAHLYGCAADFTIPDYGDPLSVCKAIEPHLEEWGIDQLIYECPSGVWVHLGIAIPPNDDPRCQTLTITSSGTYSGLNM